MKFLKYLGLTVIGILLFFSLSVFGLAFTINSTALSPRYITTEISRIDVANLTQEFITDYGKDIPANLQSDLITTISKIEPVVKDKLHNAVYSVYDYLLGKKTSPELASTLHNTFMNSGFVASLLEGIDIRALAQDYIDQNSGSLPDEIQLIVPYLDLGIAELEPWIKQQVASATGPVFDYMLGNANSFSISISTEPIKKAINGAVKEAFLSSPPAAMAGQSRDALSLYYDVNVSVFLKDIDAAIVIDQTILSDADMDVTVLTGANGPITEAEKGLKTARTYVSYFQTGFWLLFGFILLLIMGIILIYRQFKGASRDMSIIFLTCGIPALVGVLIARTALGSLILEADIPVQVQSLVTHVCNDTLAPYMWYNIGLIIVGVSLLVVSLVVKPPEEN
jgi:hypothetical protein